MTYRLVCPQVDDDGKDAVKRLIAAFKPEDGKINVVVVGCDDLGGYSIQIFTAPAEWPSRRQPLSEAVPCDPIIGAALAFGVAHAGNNGCYPDALICWGPDDCRECVPSNEVSALTEALIRNRTRSLVTERS